MKSTLPGDSVSMVYHSVLYVNGTVCDLTEQPRRTVVKVLQYLLLSGLLGGERTGVSGLNLWGTSVWGGGGGGGGGGVGQSVLYGPFAGCLELDRDLPALGTFCMV